MKRITILLTTLLTIAFAAGCRDEASLDGLESQTKEDGTSAGETAESKAVKEMLTYESDLEYNWVTEYAPAEGLSYTILFNFLSFWNEYIISMTLMSSTKAPRTLPVGLLNLMQAQQSAAQYGTMYAGLVLVMLPTLILYICVQRQLTQGMTVGGLKG